MQLKQFCDFIVAQFEENEKTFYLFSFNNAEDLKASVINVCHICS